MMRAWLAGVFVATLPLGAALAQEQGRPTPQPVVAEPAEPARAVPPRLIVAISVDQLSADLFNEYRPLFTGGLARLARGVVFPQGYQAHAATETCPGHSTILTGAHPARSGIVANNWYDLSLNRDDRRVYCAEDPTVPGTASGSGRYAPSVNFLRVPTLGQRMHSANPATRVVSVAGKDRAAIMLAGRGADETWWLSPSGLSTYRGTEASPVVARISGVIAAALGRERPAMPLPQQCASRDVAVALSDGRTVGTGRFARAAGDMRAFAASPEADGAVLAAAAALRAELRLGQGTATDLLAIGLSATDYIGHGFGTGGTEMCIQMLSLDRQLGEFFAQLDASGVDYAVVLTADHGGHDIPERNRQNAIPAAERVDAGLTPERLSERIAAELGLIGRGQLLYADGPFGDYYVSRTLNTAERTRVQTAALTIMRGHPQVELAMSGDELAALPIPTRSPELWTLAERIRASFMPERSGDIYMALRTRVTPIPVPAPGYAATHGSIWDYDRRVPILFWRAGLAGFEQPNPVMVVDIAPTLAGLVGIAIPEGAVDGRCLDLISGPASSCPR
jgi:predicted AlkP superfamily pyrophosphatase or phosphodiesterase